MYCGGDNIIRILFIVNVIVGVNILLIILSGNMGNDFVSIYVGIGVWFCLKYIYRKMF